MLPHPQRVSQKLVCKRLTPRRGKGWDGVMTVESVRWTVSTPTRTLPLEEEGAFATPSQREGSAFGIDLWVQSVLKDALVGSPPEVLAEDRPQDQGQGHGPLGQEPIVEVPR